MSTHNDIATATEKARGKLRGTTSRRKRSEIGQFLTPSPIATFMASLFERPAEEARILDPGAGAGALFGALVTTLCARKVKPKAIDVMAYENDESLKRCLDETMVLCGNACTASGIHSQQEVCWQDFVPMALEEVDDGLFGEQRGGFTHAILNPPYKKINGQTQTRRLLDAAGMEVSNLYAAFVWLAARLLEPGGELVAITPRSFCNGPYFRRFRRALLDMMSLKRIHVFESRKKAFGDDRVLQENVIIYAVKEQGKPQRVAVSSSQGEDFENASLRWVPYGKVVLPGDKDAFIHFMLNDADDRVMQRMNRFRTFIGELGLDISTGRVVDFRAREYLRQQPHTDTAPLVYPCHFKEGFVRWPRIDHKKPNAIVSSEKTRALLVEAGTYVLTKRFSAKEERRRVVAAIYDPKRIPAPLVGFENHLNYFHAQGRGISPILARGLALYVNSSLFDQYFRLFSGHTQVNATDLRKMRYPSRQELMRLGAHVKQQLPDQETLDAILEEECGSDG